MKIISALAAMLCILTVNIFAQNVIVNPGNGSYPTLKNAFDSINAGVHTGIITIEIVNNTTETFTATLNASGSGLASYTSILVRPSGGQRTITFGAFAGAVIKLNGADNVTIDGRIGGTGRNLIISNTNTTSPNAGIWLSSLGAGLGCTKNVIRNCEIRCGAPQNTTPANSYGIISSGGAIGGANGPDNDSNMILENRIIKCRYGILLFGVGANNNDDNIVSSNIIGPTFFGSDEIGKTGILIQLQNNCLVFNNEVQFVGGTFGQTNIGVDRAGIAVGSESWANIQTNTIGTNNKIIGNKIHDIIDERENSAVGIIMSTTASGPPTNNLIANNVIYNIRSNGTSAGGNNAVGIGHSGDRGDMIVFNTICMTGDLDPSGVITGLQSAAGIRVTTNIDSALTIRNNSIYVDIISNSPTLLHYCIIMPSASYPWGSGNSNYNNYFHPASNPQMRLGGLGTSNTFTSISTIASWRSTFTPNQDANSNFADPLFINIPSDLRPQEGSPLIGAGIPVFGITTDILGELRHLTNPTIGAYENEVSILNLTMYMEGFYNAASNLLNEDTVRVYLRNTSFPYAIVDSAKAYLSNAGIGTFSFKNISNGINYYIQLKHRNSIETWSASGISFTSGSATYDFTPSAATAFGGNMKQVDISPIEFAIYGGDTNQDGVVDATDAGAIDNDAFNFVTGYVITDLTGDEIVDATDAAIADNNAFNFVTLVRP